MTVWEDDVWGDGEMTTVSELVARVKELEARIKKAEWSWGWATHPEQFGPACPWCEEERSRDWYAPREFGHMAPWAPTNHAANCEAFTPDGVVK